MRAMSRPDTTGRPLPAQLSKDDPDLAVLGHRGVFGQRYLPHLVRVLLKIGGRLTFDMVSNRDHLVQDGRHIKSDPCFADTGWFDKG